MSGSGTPADFAERARREEAVRRVLLDSVSPIGPTDIARQIGEPWCCTSWGAAQSAPINPILKRIGAVRHKGGRYTIGR